MIKTVLANRKVQVIGGLLIAMGSILLAANFLAPSDSDDQSSSPLPVVEVVTAADLAGQSIISLIGTVRAFDEAAITTEASGRVTGVQVRLGSQVAAGQIIATLENASERASVLQAEGGYEAALAAASQSDVSVNEANNNLNSAKQNALTVHQTAYGTARQIVLTDIDEFFSTPNSSIPGLRIDGQGQTTSVNASRVALRTTLNEWESRVNALTIESDLAAVLNEANADLAEVISLVDVFISLFNRAQTDPDSRYSDAELNTFIQRFTAIRGTLLSSSSGLNNAVTQITAAREALARAEVGGTASQNSAADAQVKQALGSLRSAQAQLAKTIVRSPISGTVNAMSIRTGDFVGVQQQVAEVANNDALEIVTAISVSERNSLQLGDTISIEGGIKGVVTEIAPAVDAVTGKIEVRIAAESADLQNGDTVSLSLSVTDSSDDRIFVPLTSVKFEQNDGLIFSVVDGALISNQIELGVIRGSSVEVTNGLTASDEFVLDARGLQAGTLVEVTE